MARRRVSVMVAILAALVWAPSSVFGAAPNQLSQPSVTPASGGTSTLFVVTVRYRSAHPATVVTAKAGGVTSVMTLVTGSATDGTWSGVITLPPGDWDITVEASVATGSPPYLLAGSVNVAGGTSTTAPNDSMPSSGDGPSEGGGGASASPLPQAAATPAPVTRATPAPAITHAAAPPSQPPTQPAHGGASPARPGRGGEAPARSPRPNATGSSQGAQRSPAASLGAADTPSPGQDSGDLGLFMLVGSMAVGMVALIGSAWIVLAGRRDRQAVADPGATAAAIVDRRTVRRARLRSADDPILAAMGLPDEDAASAPARPPAGKSPRNGASRRTPKR